MNTDTSLWVDKYIPNSIDDIILDPTQKKYFKDLVTTKNIPHLTLEGGAGRGKTTLAKLLCKELGAVTLFVPCGTKGTIDTVRTTITEFVQSKTIDDELKIVILDEFDSASGALGSGVEDDGKANNNTMKSLRSLIEEHQNDTRFIITCNYVNKIIGPILSRCQPIKLKFTQKDILLRLITILKNEEIKYTKESITQFVNVIIKKKFPDIRQIISILQTCCSTDELIVNETEDESNSFECFAKELIDMTKVKKPQEVRQYLIQNKAIFNEEYGKLAGIILDKCIDDITIDKTKNIIEYIYRIDHVVDPEIQFFGMILELYQ